MAIINVYNQETCVLFTLIIYVCMCMHIFRYHMHHVFTTSRLVLHPLYVHYLCCVHVYHHSMHAYGIAESYHNTVYTISLFVLCVCAHIIVLVNIQLLIYQGFCSASHSMWPLGCSISPGKALSTEIWPPGIFSCQVTTYAR